MAMIIRVERKSKVSLFKRLTGEYINVHRERYLQSCLVPLIGLLLDLV